MKKPNLVDRLRYQFDRFISRGTIALLVALIAVTSCVVTGAATLLVLTGLRQAGRSEELTFAEAVWLAATRMLDPGTVADDAGWWYRLVGFVVTVSGVFLSSALVGILVSGLYQRLDDLRRGRTPIIENDHTLILGWSPLIFTILHELASAHRTRSLKGRDSRAMRNRQRSCCVVILSERDRLEVEEEIRLRGGDLPGVRVVCRSGNPLDPDILPMVSPQTAHAIIVLSPGGAYPDLPVAKALIALVHERREKKQRYHVVAALQNPSNLETVRLVSDPDVQLFSTDRLLAYLTGLVCRQPGLLGVYENLVRFEGNPIQFLDLSPLVGADYKDAVNLAKNTAVIGLTLSDGSPLLNPPLDTRIRSGDRLIVIGPSGLRLDESDKTHFHVNTEAICSKPLEPELPGRLLVLGWNRRAPILLEALGLYEPGGIEVTILADLSLQQMQNECAGLDCGSLQMDFVQGNPYDRPTLETIWETGYPHVVILSPTEPPQNQHADVYTMISWLYLQELAQETAQKFTVIREVADVYHRDLASGIIPSEALVREGLVGLVLAQVAQNKALGPLLTSLLAPSNVRIVLRPVQDYVRTSTPVNFFTVMAAAQARGETAIGYQRISEMETDKPIYGLHLAPKWTEPISFTEEDLLVLLVGGRHLNGRNESNNHENTPEDRTT